MRICLNSFWHAPSGSVLLRLIVALALLLEVAGQVGLAAEAGVILLVHPPVFEPYSELIEQFRLGISQSSAAVVITRDTKAYQASDKTQGIQAAVAMGHNALASLSAQSPPFPVYSAFDPWPSKQNTPGISVYVDPDLFIRTLKKLAPQRKRLFLIYHSQTPQRVIEAVRQSAAQQGIVLTLHPCASLKTCVVALDGTLHEAGAQDAVWVHRGVIALNKELILPALTERAWPRKVLVFSSDPEYVRRGLVFSLVPDYLKTGRRMGEMIAHPETGAQHGPAFITDVSAVLNTRTARHIGIELSPGLKHEFDMIYPAR